MSSGGDPFALPQGPLNGYDSYGEDMSKAVRQEFDSAERAGDPTRLETARVQMRTLDALGEVREQLNGVMSGYRQHTDDQVAAAEAAAQAHRKLVQQGRLLQIPEYKAFIQGHNSFIEQYKLHNKVELEKLAQSGDELDQRMAMNKLDKVYADPNELAAHRQNFAKLMAAAREIDPEYDPMQDPQIREAVRWLNKEEGAGFVASGEQPDQRGFMERAVGDITMMGAEAVAGVGDMAGEAFEGMRQLVNMAARGAMGDDAPQLAGWDNYVLDPQTGEVITNEGEYPGFWRSMQMSGMVISGYNNEQIARYVAEKNADEAYIRAKSNGFESVAFAASRFAGFVGGIGAASAGAEAAAGSLLTKGLQRLAVDPSAKTQALIARLARFGGAAAVNGAHDALVHGTGGIEEASTSEAMMNLGRSFIGGAAVTLPIMMLGAMGGRASTLLQRKSVPKAVSDRVSDAIMGAGLGSGMLELVSPTFEALKNDTDQGWESFLASVGGMMLLGASRGRMGQFDDTDMAARIQRQQAVDLEAERAVERAEMDEPGQPVAALEGSLRQLGMALREEKTTRLEPGERATQARERVSQLREQVIQQEAKERQIGDERTAERVTGVQFAEGELGSQRADPSRFAERAEDFEGEVPSVYEIVEVFRGDPGEPGIQVPFADMLGFPEGRVGGRAGTEVQVPIDYGRARSLRGKRYGFYNTEQNVARIKGRGEVFVAAHEWSHAAMRASFGIPNDYDAKSFDRAVSRMNAELSPEARSELGVVLEGYAVENLNDAGVLAEGWAETMARLVMGDNSIYQEAPNLAAYVQGKVEANPRLAKQFGAAREKIVQRTRAGATERMMSDQGRGVTKREQEMRRRRSAGGWWARTTAGFVRNMGDEIVDLRRSRDAWLRRVGKSRSDIDIFEDPVALHDAMIGTAGTIATQMLQREAVDIAGNRVGESLRDILQGAKESLGDRGVEKLFAFINAHQTLSMAEAGKKTANTTEEAARTIADLSAQVGEGELRKVAIRLKAYTDNLVDVLRDSGAIDAESAARIKGANDFYSPMYRDIPESYGRAGGAGGTRDPLRKREGSERELLNPVESLERLTHDTMLRAQEAMVKRSFLGLARQKGTENIVQEIDRSSAVKQVEVREMLEALKTRAQRTGEPVDLIDDLIASDVSDATLTQFLLRQQPGGKDHNIIAVNDDGKTVWLEIKDPKVYDAMFAVQPQLQNAAMRMAVRALRGPTEVLKFFATGISPAFAIANTFRDIMFRSVASDRGYAGSLGRYGLGVFGGVMDYVAGAVDMVRKGEATEIRRRIGGEMSQYQTELARDYADAPRSRLIEMARTAADKVSRVIGLFEQPLRIKEFSDALREARTRGMDEQSARLYALGESREVMVNFAKGGAVAKMLNNAIPYFNAGVVSQDKFWRHLRTTRGMTQMLANIAVPSVLLALLFRDDERYRDIPDVHKLNYWTIPFGDDVIYIPKPFEAGVMFGSIPQKLIEDGATLDEDMRRALVGAFIPYAGDFYSRLVPQAVKPLVEAYTGKDFYFGTDITPRGLTYKRPEEQVKYNTTATAQFLFENLQGPLGLLGIDNPLEVEKVLEGYVTRAAYRGLMEPLETLTGARDHSDYMRIDPMSRFYRGAERVPSEATNKLYRERDRIQRIPRQERTAEDRVKLRRFNRAANEMSDLRKMYQAGRISMEEWRLKSKGVAFSAWYEED